MKSVCDVVIKKIEKAYRCEVGWPENPDVEHVMIVVGYDSGYSDKKVVEAIEKKIMAFAGFPRKLFWRFPEKIKVEKSGDRTKYITRISWA